MSKSPHDVLSSVFGYDTFRGEQESIINDVVAGRSCGVLMPTGSGKSLCYQIPSICMDGTGIIVSPLIALMNDQVMALRDAGVNAAAIHSGLEFNDLQSTMRDLREGNLDLVYVAPERLVNDAFLDVLDNIKIALFAIDEAHCISQWGHDFRPDYRQVSLLRTRYPDTPCIAVTATADTPTRNDIVNQLNLPKLYVAGFDRPNITYQVAIKDNPRSQLLNFLKNREQGESGIVYCLSRKKVEETASWLSDQGYNALPYHARLDVDVKDRNQDKFIREDGVIIVATIAFGMGINKPDVRFVAHMDLPKNIEAYYQETGRAGRDGLPAVAWMVCGLSDLAVQNSMIENSPSPEDQKRIERQKLSAFLGYCESATCRRQVLLNYFDDTGEPCGNCDICTNPPKTFDGSIAAQKLLSAILRTGQRFGGGHVIDVLLGKATEKVTNFQHDDFLRNKPELQLIVAPKSTKESYASKSSTKLKFETEYDEELFLKLKALRLDIARENNIPPYVVFHDKTLAEMVAVKPANLNEMGNILGVGQSKLSKYGDAFLDVLN